MTRWRVVGEVRRDSVRRLDRVLGIWTTRRHVEYLDDLNAACATESRRMDALLQVQKDRDDYAMRMAAKKAKVA